ncbi:hypothetical protein CCUS01_08465 [Colletotrichum cuscutae]|uniref:Uncharacterized protein n=1 Tax=Colletotrichum cuscutae TaxID=1209917 RepID=A0AAI9UQY8_9PEZI|nr:hypothetical protein CCUS01_08465 [Colletotrichum cuscutae]
MHARPNRSADGIFATGFSFAPAGPKAYRSWDVYLRYDIHLPNFEINFTVVLHANVASAVPPSNAGQTTRDLIRKAADSPSCLEPSTFPGYGQQQRHSHTEGSFGEAANLRARCRIVGVAWRRPQLVTKCLPTTSNLEDSITTFVGFPAAGAVFGDIILFTAPSILSTSRHASSRISDSVTFPASKLYLGELPKLTPEFAQAVTRRYVKWMPDFPFYSIFSTLLKRMLSRSSFIPTSYVMRPSAPRWPASFLRGASGDENAISYFHRVIRVEFCSVFASLSLRVISRVTEWVHFSSGQREVRMSKYLLSHDS